MIFWRSLSTRSKKLIFLALGVISLYFGSFFGVLVTLPRVFDGEIGALDPVAILTLYVPYFLTAVFIPIAISFGLREDRENIEKWQK